MATLVRLSDIAIATLFFFFWGGGCWNLAWENISLVMHNLHMAVVSSASYRSNGGRDNDIPRRHEWFLLPKRDTRERSSGLECPGIRREHGHWLLSGVPSVWIWYLPGMLEWPLASKLKFFWRKLLTFIITFLTDGNSIILHNFNKCNFEIHCIFKFDLQVCVYLSVVRKTNKLKVR